MDHWDLRTLGVKAHQPQILHSSRGESRSVVIALPAGEMLQDHQVHERAHVVVIDGDVEIAADSSVVAGGPGSLVIFDPGERHEVRATTDARLLLVLAPWPGHVHPGRVRTWVRAAGPREATCARCGKDVQGGAPAAAESA